MCGIAYILSKAGSGMAQKYDRNTMRPEVAGL